MSSFILVNPSQTHSNKSSNKNDLETTEVISYLSQTINQDLNLKEVINLKPKPDKANIGIDQVRDLLTKLSFKAAGQRLVIISPAELLTLEAQNALLKTLEEPPPATFLILTTSQPNRLIPTVRSRCHLIFIKEQKKQLAKKAQPTYQLKTFTEAIRLAEKYKDKQAAYELIKQLVKETSYTPKQRRLISQTLNQLDQNLNVRLTLEQLFFKLILHKPKNNLKSS